MIDFFINKVVGLADTRCFFCTVMMIRFGKKNTYLQYMNYLYPLFEAFTNQLFLDDERVNPKNS